MYIKKYWGNFIGGSDDSLNLAGTFRGSEKGGDPPQRDFLQDRSGQAELGLSPNRGVPGVYTFRWCGDGLSLRH